MEIPRCGREIGSHINRRFSLPEAGRTAIMIGVCLEIYSFGEFSRSTVIRFFT